MLRSLIQRFCASKQAERSANTKVSTTPTASVVMNHHVPERIVLSFDVETLGLYGPVLSVGACVLKRNTDGTIIELDSMETAVDFSVKHAECPKIDPATRADARDEEWVSEHVVPAMKNRDCICFKQVRDRFWNFFTSSTKKHPGMLVAVDCGVPTEAYFLRKCVLDDFENRKWASPYPLHDLGTLLLAHGQDLTSEYSRNSAELPKHNPLADARQSGRLFLEMLDWSKK